MRLCFVFPQLSKTNFSNNNDFRSFLQSLCATFKEFKMHEQIENEYIIGLLQQRCCTVYNVHSDNKLSEMLSLFENGLHSVKVDMHWFIMELLGFFYVLVQQGEKKQNRLYLRGKLHLRAHNSVIRIANHTNSAVPTTAENSLLNVYTFIVKLGNYSACLFVAESLLFKRWQTVASISRKLAVLATCTRLQHENVTFCSSW